MRRRLRSSACTAVLVSPISRFNAVNLLWRTNCESGIRGYEVHRSTAAGFEPSAATRIALVDARSILKGGNAYGQSPIDYRLDEFDHQMYFDNTVEPSTTYCYRVCAVDAAGRKGPFSPEVRATTKAPDPLAILAKGITAQSVYAAAVRRGTGDRRLDRSELGLDLEALRRRHEGESTRRLVGIPVPRREKLALAGVKIIGDHRDVIPLQKNLQVQARLQGQWKTVGRVIGAGQKDFVVTWPQPVETGAIRVLVPATDLPEGGVVRICELLFLLPDGREAAPLDVFGH